MPAKINPDRKYPQRIKTVAEKEVMRVGGAIAAQLTPLRSLREVARAEGLTPSGVQQIERRALYKIAMRMRQLHAQGDLT